MTEQCNFANKKGHCKSYKTIFWWLNYNKGTVTVSLCKRHAPKSEDEKGAV